jgi:hypothetical protein
MEHILEILADNSRAIGSQRNLSRGHVFSPLQRYHLVMNIFLRV